MSSVPNSYTKILNFYISNISDIINIYMLGFFNTGYLLYGLSLSAEIPSYLIKLIAVAIWGFGIMSLTTTDLICFTTSTVKKRENPKNNRLISVI